MKQCFICREFSRLVSKSWSHVDLCLPCYVDCLEVRERRGKTEPLVPLLGEGPDESVPAAHVIDEFLAEDTPAGFGRQLDMFQTRVLGDQFRLDL